MSFALYIVNNIKWTEKYQEVLQKEKLTSCSKLGVVVSVVAIVVIISLLRDNISLKNVQLSTVDTQLKFR